MHFAARFARARERSSRFGFNSIITKCIGECVESMYSTGLTPSILIFGLDQAFVRRVRHEISQQELLLVMEFFRISITGNDDIGPVVATRDVQAHAIVLKK